MSDRNFKLTKDEAIATHWISRETNEWVSVNKSYLLEEGLIKDNSGTYSTAHIIFKGDYAVQT